MTDTIESLTAERDALKSRVAELERVVQTTAGILQAEMGRSGGRAFTGTWTFPSLGIRMTCSEALDLANDALASDEEASS